MRVVLATGNPGKAREFAALLPGWEIVIPRDLGIQMDVVEDGATFEENAMKKARALAAAARIPSIADDSGLEVLQLDGAPGIFSARFAGNAASDEQNMDLLRLMLKDHPQPHPARFVCALAFAAVDGEAFTVRGECPGEIILDRRGKNGFGYDPMFLYPPLGQTFAQMDDETKNRISHRARAIAAFRKRIQGGEASCGWA